MTLFEGISIGIIVALFSGILGILIGGAGKVSKETCNNKRNSCNTIVCNELKHIKEEQKEMKLDIKELLKRIKNS